MTTAQISSSSPPHERYAGLTGVYFRDGVLFTFVLTSVLYLTLAISLGAAGWVEYPMDLLVPATAGALVMGLLMAMSRFDGFFMVSHGIFTSLAWILYLMAGLVSKTEVQDFVGMGIPMLRAQAYFLLLRWLDWVEAAMNRTPNGDNLVFILYISLLVWWLAYLATWSIFRYGFVWRGVIPGGIALLINTYYAPKPVVPLLVIFCFVALVLLVRTNLAEQQLRWREQHIRFDTEVTFDFLRDGLWFSILVVAFAWILPSLGRNIQLAQVMEPFNQRWEDTTQEWNRLYTGLNRQSRPVGGSFGRTLTLGGARDVTNTPVIQVNAPVGRYWRAVVYDTFTGRQWLNTAQDEAEYQAGAMVPASAWGERIPITQTVTLIRPIGSVLIGAPDIVRSNVAFTALTWPTTADFGPAGSGEAQLLDRQDRPMEITLARAQQPLDTGESYSLVSEYTNVTEWSLFHAGTDYPAPIRDRFLQLPENFSPRVAALAEQVTAPYDTVYAKTKALEGYLRSYTYDDNIQAPASDQDPVEYFLFDIQRGYCDYYATTMAVMLRRLGIPARTASGYAEGAYDEESGVYFITDKDAHTWVEVYFPGLGWIEFEPTAGESLLIRPAGSDPNESGMTGQTEQDTLNPDRQQLNDPLDEAALLNENQGALALELGGSSLVRWIWILLSVVGVGLGVFLVWRVRRVGSFGFNPHLPPILYARLQSWAERLGLTLLPGHTPLEQAKRLGHALPTGRPQIDQITHGYVRYRFAPTDSQSEPRSERGTNSPSEWIGPDHTAGNGEESWHHLRPVLWRAWLRKHLRLPFQGRPEPLERVKGSDRSA